MHTERNDETGSVQWGMQQGGGVNFKQESGEGEVEFLGLKFKKGLSRGWAHIEPSLNDKRGSVAVLHGVSNCVFQCALRKEKEQKSAPLRKSLKPSISHGCNFFLIQQDCDIRNVIVVWKSCRDMCDDQQRSIVCLCERQCVL